MDLYDVVFPVNIGALTYRCPAELSGIVKPGMIISAHLKNSVTKGVILRKASGKPPGVIKDIMEAHTAAPVMSGSLIRLLDWMSDYYIAERGIVLKHILPRELLSRANPRKSVRINPMPIDAAQIPDNSISSLSADNDLAAAVAASIGDPAYRTFLLHAPSSDYAHAFLMKTIADAGQCIILVPEITLLKSIYARLHELFGRRLCLFHSELRRDERRRSLEQILSAQSDIILGTRSAVFAPLKKVSFIAVLDEHNTSYKQECSPCYNGRDVAVMRGFFEKATVLLSSVRPSVESFYNCRSGKYTLLKPSSGVKMPGVRVIDMRYEKHIKPYLSKAAVEAAAKCLKSEGRVMFVINRRGYSTLLECQDCNYVEECPDCRIPLVYHKQDMTMKCHYCGHLQSKMPELCKKCKGHNVQLLGAGTQRVQEDIEQIFGIKGARLDSDRMRRRSVPGGETSSAFLSENRIVIGTKLMTRRLNRDITFSMAVILNADSLLNLPDFRSAEKAYQEIIAVMEKIDPGGKVLIQTRMPQHYIFKSTKSNNYDDFFQEELQRRRALLYPPFSRLVIVRCFSKRDLSKQLSGSMREAGKDDVDILGPSILKNKKGEYEYKLLLRSPSRRRLHAAAKSVIETFSNSRDVRIRIDVDPQVI